MSWKLSRELPNCPPLGMPRKVKITLKHDCLLGCTCKITVSTCTLQVNLSCSYRSLAKMLEIIVSSVKLSQGSDAIQCTN